MNSAPIQFHKVWIEQCEATKGIHERFGLEKALHYLIGETLQLRPGFGRRFRLRLGVAGLRLPIRRIFSVDEIRNCLDELERDKFIAPSDPEPDIDDLDDDLDDEPWPSNPVMAAEELLRFSRIRQLLTE